MTLGSELRVYECIRVNGNGEMETIILVSLNIQKAVVRGEDVPVKGEGEKRGREIE